MGFDAASVVEPLDWDFTKYDAGKGTVPEPTDKQIDTFFREIAKAMSEMFATLGIDQKDVANTDPAQVLEAISDVKEDTPLTSKVFAAIFKSTAKLCGNQPSLTQLNKLPLRVRSAFVTWLLGELSPELGGTASRNLGVVPGANGQLALPPGLQRIG